MSVSAAELTAKKCTACEGGTPPFTKEQIAEYLAVVPEWKLSDDGNMAITTLIGTNRPMDFASNTGVILSRVPAGVTAPVMAIRSSAAVLRQIPVRWGKR